jgi:toxin ParE1/3/4
VDVIFTQLAERQIDNLHEYSAANSNEERAYGYIGRLIRYCTGLSTFPQRGTRRDDILPTLRTIGFENRVTIAFVVTGSAVLIEGIFYGGQDFEAVLRG